jgi:Na+-translocating ferredoxin:NAD+ oxidoreductase RnfC subunit
MSSASQIAKENGIVGAGGAAFPTHVKLAAKAEIIIANAAECEPLLYKDEEILRNFPGIFLKGLRLAAESLGAEKAVIGIKEKHLDVIAGLKMIAPRGIEISLLKDAYPSGDEFLLVYDVTRRQIPKGGIPLDVGVVVQNVETLYNLGLQKPVTEKFITISGDVDEALTLKVPIGIKWSEIVRLLKIDISGRGFLLGGPMMGSVADNLDVPVTKADSGLLILPNDHSLLVRKRRTDNSVRKIAFSCDQCMRCSDLCPRDLLGHGVKPHKAMIALTMSLDAKISWQRSSLYCCECGLCTLYACPEDLDPSRVMISSKKELFSSGQKPRKEFAEVHPMYEYRRTPTKLLLRRLGLEDFVRPHRYIEKNLKPDELVIRLRQHRGSAALPVVKKGQRVKALELIGEIEEGKMGSRIFSPMDAVVKIVEENNIVLEVV